jgi:hypothetical protein
MHPARRKYFLSFDEKIIQPPRFFTQGTIGLAECGRNGDHALFDVSYCLLFFSSTTTQPASMRCRSGPTHSFPVPAQFVKHRMSLKNPTNPKSPKTSASSVIPSPRPCLMQMGPCISGTSRAPIFLQIYSCATCARAARMSSISAAQMSMVPQSP